MMTMVNAGLGLLQSTQIHYDDLALGQRFAPNLTAFGFAPDHRYRLARTMAPARAVDRQRILGSRPPALGRMT